MPKRIQTILITIHLRFERACTAFEMRQEHRSTQCARLLQGKALDVYQRLADDEVDDR